MLALPDLHQMTCPHLISSGEGTSYCALAEQTAGQLAALIAERDELRADLEILLKAVERHKKATAINEPPS